jgi:predicted metal-dependent hydrolase
MDAMDNETRRRLEEEIVELQAQHEEALKTTFSSQKERDRELNRIKTAIRYRRKEIMHPGLATKQKRERRRQIREQRVMEENTRNHAHRGLDSLASSLSHIAVAAATQARAYRT